MIECSNCRGKGLISSGAVPHDLESGQTQTCAVCGGTGQVLGGENVVAPEGTLPMDESPKVEAPSSEDAGGEVSGEQSVIVPSVGDMCMTEDGRPGTLQHNNEGWVCVADEA